MLEIYKYAIVIGSTLFAAFGNCCFKMATVNIHKPLDVLKSKYVYIGATVYFGSTLLYIVSHHFLGVYVIVAVGSLTYIWSMILAKVLLKEKISRLKIIGSFLIVFGTILAVYAKYKA